MAYLIEDDRVNNKDTHAKRRDTVMKKKILLCLIMAIALVVLFSSCGNSTEPIDGIWVGDGPDETILVIDGDIGYWLHSFSFDDSGYISKAKCIVDTQKKTIDFYDPAYCMNETIYCKNYRLSEDELVIESADDSNFMNGNYSHPSSGEELRDSSEMSLDDEWVAENAILSISGNSGNLDYYDDYYGHMSFSCSVDNTNKTITINGFSSTGDNAIYEYYLINGKLLLFCIEPRSSMEHSFLLEIGSEYDAAGKERPKAEEKSQEEKDKEERERKEEKEKEENKQNAQNEIKEAVKDKKITDTGEKQIWEVYVKDGEFRMVADYSGSGNFIVKLSDPNQNLEEVLCNEIGDYHLDKTVYVPSGLHYLQIESNNGYWEGQWYGTFGY